VISGAIAFFVPDRFFERYVNNEFLSMLLMVALGIPMYTCVTASIPVAVALMLKGLSPGAAFVFLTVGPATNFSFIMVIAHVMGKKIVTVYLTTLAVMSIIAGYGLNWIFSITGKQSLDSMLTAHFCKHTAPWELIASVMFLAIICMSFYRIWTPKVLALLGLKKAGPTSCSIDIEGMSCKNCARKITESIKKVEGVSSVDVDVGKKKATIEGKADVDSIKKAVEDAGYKVK
jgi:copper chaperone CopZ